MTSNGMNSDLPSPNSQLLAACAAGDLARVTVLLNGGADPETARVVDGVTPLMLAAEGGFTDIIAMLLEAGAPWHAQDHEGYTAGEYALGTKQQEAFQFLLECAVEIEMVLETPNERVKGKSGPVNAEYLGQKLRYEDGRLVDEDNEAVMMGWEAPLMVKHAEIVSGPGKDVLNIGFGLGIIDSEIQKHNPRSHTIVEAHPDVLSHMIEQGWDKRPGVKIVFGRWQDVLKDLGTYDGIFFDTYAEYYQDMKDFHDALPTLLRPGGVYSFFMGLAPDNWFFHLVYGEIVRRELNKLGMSVKFDAIPIDVSSDACWEGIANRYWHLPMYFLPTCVMPTIQASGDECDEAA